MSFPVLKRYTYEAEDIIMNDNEEEITDKYSDEDDEYEEMLMSYEEDDESIIPELYFCNPDPFLKPEPLPDDHYRPEIHFDDEGRIVVKNLDAYWLPEMKLVEEIDGTIYTVTGSYEGTEMLDQKLSRIMLHNLENF
jgi:hypothetical protein